MSRARRTLAIVPVILLAVAARPGVARAQEISYADARAAYEAGVEAMGAQRFEEAIEHFARSLALRASPVVVYNLALAHRELSHDVQACSLFLRYARHPESGADPERLRAVADEILRLRASVAVVEWAGNTPPRRLQLDGQSIDAGDPTCVAPGAHQLSAEFDDGSRAVSNVQLSSVDWFRWQTQWVAPRVADLPAVERRPARGVAPFAPPWWTWAGAGLAATSVAGAAVLQFVGNPMFERYQGGCTTGDVRDAAGCRARFDELVTLQGAIYGLDAVAVLSLATAAVGIGVGLARPANTERGAIRIRASVMRAAMEVAW